MEALLQSWMPLAAALLVSAVSLIGACTLWLSTARLRVVVPLLVSLAVGALLGDAFLHLIPDAVEELGSLSTVCAFTLGGIVLFFAIEKVVRWRHDHHVPEQQDARIAVQPLAKMNLVGDAVHNFTDGILIAGSFAVDPFLGWTTTAAIVVHEIPQELGDVGALIHGGYAPRRAVLLNFVCSWSVIASVVATLIVSHWAQAALPYLLPVAAGGFIYIAVGDFIPSLHVPARQSQHALQMAAVIAGVMCMIGVTAFEHALPPRAAAVTASVPPPVP